MIHKIAVAACAVAFAIAPARAFWSDDPAINLAVAEGAGEQVVPLVAATQDGGTYVAWFDNSAGSYQVRLQHLDAVGVERWPHNGILVSAHPQDTALFGWDMIADSAGGAVIVFSDTRDGGDLDIHAYRIAPDGSFPWGPDGVTLSSNPDFEPAPRVVEASDGDFVFVWMRDPSSGDADIRMQRLSPAGDPRLAAGGIAAVASAGEDPGFVQLVPADNGTVILAWLRNIRSFSSPRHLHARKFSATGQPVWPATVIVYNAFPLPIGYFPEIRPDGAGGIVLVWHRSDGSLYMSFVQRLDATGAPLFPVGGVAVTTDGSRHHIGPAPAYDPATGSTIVFWNPRNPNQSQWGIQGQKISSAGAREWGPNGIELRPVDTAYETLPRAVPLDGGAVTVFTDQPGAGDRLVAMRLAADGSKPWGAAPVVVSSATSGKARYPVAIDRFGVTRIVWEDDRHGTPDVYAQNLRPGGALGVSPVPGTIGPTLRIAKSETIPGDLVLRWDGSCSPGAGTYGIYEGSLGDFANRAARTCTDASADRVEALTPAAGDRYYLIVALGPANEGSHGTDSQGVERPFPAVACRAVQNTTACGGE